MSNGSAPIINTPKNNKIRQRIVNFLKQAYLIYKIKEISPPKIDVNIIFPSFNPFMRNTFSGSVGYRVYSKSSTFLKIFCFFISLLISKEKINPLREKFQKILLIPAFYR